MVHFVTIHSSESISPIRSAQASHFQRANAFAGGHRSRTSRGGRPRSSRPALWSELPAARRGSSGGHGGKVDLSGAGGYFLVAETDGQSDVDFCRALAKEKQVVCTPMSVFYATPFPPDRPCQLVRFTICKSPEHIKLACDALRA